MVDLRRETLAAVLVLATVSARPAHADGDLLTAKSPDKVA